MGVWTTTEIRLAGGIYPAPPVYLFRPDDWPDSTPVAAGGRGSAWFVSDQRGDFVLRHYRRGGLIARVSRDHYLARGAGDSRAFCEFTLLDRLHCLGLPVPEPVAARYARRGLLYRADLLTRRIANSETLAVHLQREPLAQDQWRNLGRLLRRFHDAGARHADLNAHNILLADHSRWYLIDFDRGRLDKPGAWCEQNLARLQRSLDKLAAQSGPWHMERSDWQALRDGYDAV